MIEQQWHQWRLVIFWKIAMKKPFGRNMIQRMQVVSDKLQIYIAISGFQYNGEQSGKPPHRSSKLCIQQFFLSAMCFQHDSHFLHLKLSGYSK